MVKEYCDQSSSSPNLDLFSEYGGLNFNYEVKRLKPDEALTGLRVILSKLAFGLKDGLSPSEFLYKEKALQTLSEVRDPCFISKHLPTLESISHVVKLLKIYNKRNLQISRECLLKTLRFDSDPSIKPKHRALIPMRELVGNFANWSVSHYIKRINRLRRNKLPPQKYIGVGYKDKGTRRDPSTDASPAWQEVASNPLSSLTVNGRKLNQTHQQKVALIVRLNPLGYFRVSDKD